MQSNNVVDFLQRLKANEQKADENALATMHNYQINESDVLSFLMVMRAIQRRSRDQQVTMECGSEFFTFEIQESNASVDSQSLFFDVRSQKRSITIDFPWFILDVDRSEYQRDEDGEDVIDGLTKTLLRWFKTVEV